jgi:hypothetical protein
MRSYGVRLEFSLQFQEQTISFDHDGTVIREMFGKDDPLFYNGDHERGFPFRKDWFIQAAIRKNKQHDK